ncbi:hypothetical protein [Acinetobacter gerneri]|uniref:Uncharacterized protein n=1 Tax=Acinetobacter gerneri DSM 14967 = CIP 107464 = MTCC 9824 TaxID=1120926 RepID=N8ZQC1_9GAMM|nr:hypothetical protein [Acinetobacter gerneri]ENV33943.1 hypothetical protein F960_01949 [Acinetobacter gerneri DSM 14967 = CIP 107464 = MTCC 9824]EPR82820.1 hypothetical protein L289_2738 [Acinetobacter gerneri DSM 14967 = CIP 107464 = MTCC 9824]MDV2438682.1 hypothetical protein [Acinetobacter gerneri]
MKKENNRLAMMCFVLATFSFTGWYMAESDNQILIKEIEALKAKAHRYDR